MKAFAATLLAGATAAVDALNSMVQDRYTLNNNYDYPDQGHYHFGGDEPASPAWPIVPELSKAVGAFDEFGTLFGEHRYQLQVDKTADMMIGTEALRAAIASLENRVASAHILIHDNDDFLDENNSDIEDNRRQISENRDRLRFLDSRITDLQGGYLELNQKLAVDRDALIMMCHQYAYARTIPDECLPIIGSLTKAIEFQWYWPDAPCPLQAALPPFHHPLPQYTKETTDDDDDNISHYN